MRDVDARDPALAQGAENFEERLRLMLGQGGSGFVEDENARVFRQSLHDFDKLLMPHTQSFHGQCRIDWDLKVFQKLPRFLMNAGPVDEPETARAQSQGRYSPQRDIASTSASSWQITASPARLASATH